MEENVTYANGRIFKVEFDVTLCTDQCLHLVGYLLLNTDTDEKRIPLLALVILNKESYLDTLT